MSARRLIGIGIDTATGHGVYADVFDDRTVVVDGYFPTPINTPERHNHMSTTTDVLDVTQKQRVAALNSAATLLGQPAPGGIFAARKLPETADKITDLIEVSEYILKGHELVHYQLDDGNGVAVTAVDVIPLPEAGEPGQLERIAREASRSSRSLRHAFSRRTAAQS